MDKLETLRIFITAASAGSFVAASRSMGISAPAVTRAIAKLEQDLATPLFHRTTRTVRLTEAGSRYLRDASSILDSLEEADAAVSGNYGDPRGILTITAPVLFGERFVVPIVAEFLQQHPEVEIRSLFIDRVANLIEDNLDVAVRLGSLADSSLYSRSAGKIRKITCATPEYLALNGRPTRPKDLAKHKIIQASAVENSTTWNFKNESVRVSPSFQCNQNGAAIKAATEGIGLTRAMSYQVAKEIDSGVLELVLEDHEPPSLPVSVVYLEGRAASHRIRAFVDFAVARLRENVWLNRS